MRYLFAMLLPAALILCGCADRSATNLAIMENNRLMRKAYGDGMAACGDNAACQTGLTAAYFSNAGQQSLVPEETVLDYAKALLPYATLALQAFDLYWYGKGSTGSSGDRSSTFVKGDGNIFVSGNRMDQSLVDLDSAFTRNYDGGYNRNFTGLQPITEDGLQ